MIIMKKALFLLAMCFCLVACKSEKQKAEDIIRSYMFETLYDYNSYQPISTEVKLSGFSATHKFRCKTAGGLSRIHTWEFHIDFDEEKVSWYYDDEGKLQLP